MAKFIPALPKNLAGWPHELVVERFSKSHHGDFVKWFNALCALPKFELTQAIYAETVTLMGDLSKVNSIEATQQNSAIEQHTQLKELLQQFHPWRKGPFEIANIHIDTEWRSDWKWSRLQQHINLDQHRVLDIGCGNGYFGWRMLEAGGSGSYWHRSHITVLYAAPGDSTFCPGPTQLGTTTGHRRYPPHRKV